MFLSSTNDFSFFVNWFIKLSGLFNAKAVLVEEYE